jgi:glycosyltransferase involved in cell wall biosynthesis
VFFLATIGDQMYYQRIIDGLDEHIYMLTGDYPLWPIFKYADCFIRPTYNENFGISVAEALYCQVPVVASNVCMRPRGTILYQAANLPDLVSKTTQILQNLRLN